MRANRRHVFKQGHKITLRDYRKPVRLRHSKFAGPYYFHVRRFNRFDLPRELGFYMAQRGYSMDTHDCARACLRLEQASDYASRFTRRQPRNFFVDEYGDGDAYEPIIARLPNRRGFLSGYTLGFGMASVLNRHVYETAEEAADAAYVEAEVAADMERTYRAREEAQA